MFNKIFKITNHCIILNQIGGIMRLHYWTAMPDGLENSASLSIFGASFDEAPVQPDDTAPQLDVITGQWVGVQYDGDVYPGQIVQICQANGETDIKVNVMVRCGPNIYRWPNKMDCIFYKMQQIVQILQPPTPKNNRGHYTFDGF